MNNYILNKFVKLIKVGLNKYFIKHGILSEKSYILEFDNDNTQQIKILDKLILEKKINLDFSTNKAEIDETSKLIDFLLKESIIVPEYMEDTEAYYSLINSFKTKNGFLVKKILYIVSSEFVKEQIKNNLKGVKIDFDCIIEDFQNVDFKKYSYISVIFQKYSPDVFHKLNKIALNKNIPLQISYLDGSTSYISPIIIKNYTVCYNEMELQIESAISHRYEYLVYKNNEKNNGENSCYLPPFLLNQILFYSLHLVFDFMISGKLKTKNRAIIFDVETLRYDIVDILPLPNCPACKVQNKMSHDFL